MSDTIRGVPVSEEQIAAWVAEAEAGYDLAALEARRGGRPSRAGGPTKLVAVRLTDQELQALDAAADRERTSRSEIMRAAIEAYTA